MARRQGRIALRPGLAARQGVPVLRHRPGQAAQRPLRLRHAPVHLLGLGRPLHRHADHHDPRRLHLLPAGPHLPRLLRDPGRLRPRGLRRPRHGPGAALPAEAAAFAPRQPVGRHDAALADAGDHRQRLPHREPPHRRDRADQRQHTGARRRLPGRLRHRPPRIAGRRQPGLGAVVAGRLCAGETVLQPGHEHVDDARSAQDRLVEPPADGAGVDRLAGLRQDLAHPARLRQRLHARPLAAGRHHPRLDAQADHGLRDGGIVRRGLPARLQLEAAHGRRRLRALRPLRVELPRLPHRQGALADGLPAGHQALPRRGGPAPGRGQGEGRNRAAWRTNASSPATSSP